MKTNGDFEAEDYVQIKRMVKSLTVNEVKVDITTFLELISRHNPNGMSLIEDLRKDETVKDNPKYFFRFPKAIIEFQKILKQKYPDRKMQSAVFMKVLEELYFKNFSGNVQ